MYNKRIAIQTTLPFARRRDRLASLILGAALLLAPSVSSAIDIGAEVEVDAECVGVCVGELRTCLRDARQELRDCTLENGCVDLAASARLACAADNTASVCVEARADLSDCLKPCRVALRAQASACQDGSLQCLNQECGLTDLPTQCRRVNAPVVVTP